MEISVQPAQEELFYTLAPQTFGDAVLVSHAIVRAWRDDLPISLSPEAIGRLRARLPDTLLVTDDMQMQGLQRAMGTPQAVVQALRAGLDMLCIGNNLLNEEQAMLGIARHVEAALTSGALSDTMLQASIARVQARKSLLR